MADDGQTQAPEQQDDGQGAGQGAGQDGSSGGGAFQVSASTAELEARAIEVARPAPGESVAMSVQPGQPLRLQFDLDDVQVVQTENDIVLAFDDGAQITLTSMVPAAFSEAPPVLLLPD
ncbi:MAG: hypothetical protein GWN07_40950, partial [Actinobacteria bacterium]|nr:hypothetical protein [Actinomycetota bacterium]NIS37380.1 hypothetical protein [Actinomycetota bacterium]NIU71811.1 hypothetical protein [Actinomycetota bacterium]NIV91078.1 hypothetical protein [Actinomycetota bacterium]NIW33755.1 hypothetical protein [Actinomycetota bacterium]